MTVLTGVEEAAAKVVREVAPSVVRIGRGGGRGAGLVAGPGLVVTNAHNLRGDETTVTFLDGRSETGRLVGVDVDGDIAVVAVDTAGTGSLEWAGDDVRVGSPVFALSTTAAGQARVSFGLVSAVDQRFQGPRGRRITGSLEHTAPLRRGSSGGPVVDASGRLLGINTNRLGEGFYLALPADSALRARVEALGRGESPPRRHLGLALAPAPAARRLRAAVGLPPLDGLLVRQVQDDSPAARAGLRQGDLIVAANGVQITDIDGLFEALDAVEDGGSLALRVVRGTEELESRLTFSAGTRAEGSA